MTTWLRIIIAGQSTFKQELQSLGLSQIRDELFLDVKSAYKIIKERIYNTERQNMLAKLSNLWTKWGVILRKYY